MSQRHPTRRRKQKSDDADDVFVAGVLEATTWAERNRGAVIGGVVVTALLILGAWYWTSWSSDLENEAVVQLEQIQQTIAIGDQETAKVSLAQFLERFGSTTVAAEASLQLAELYLQTDQPAQAITTLQDSGIGQNDPLGPQAWILRGRAYEAQGQYAQAEDVYLEVAEAADLPFQQIDALADAARMRAEQDDPAGAAELYERILTSMEENHPDRGEYEMRKAEMEAMLLG